MSRCTFVWAHGLQSSRAHEDELGLFDWGPVEDVARVVRYDTRGHGQASCCAYEDRAYRWSTLVEDMLWAAGTEGPFVAGGACMGAATALYAALRAPRRIQAIVLVTPPAAWESRNGQVEEYASAAALVERHGMRSLLESWRTRPQPQILAELPRSRDITMRHLAAMDEKALPAILRGMASSDLPKPEEISSLVVPALVLAWDGDPCHPVATAEAIAERLILSELHVARDLAEVRRWPLLVREFLGNLCLWETAEG